MNGLLKLARHIHNDEGTTQWDTMTGFVLCHVSLNCGTGLKMDDIGPEMVKKETKIFASFGHKLGLSFACLHAQLEP